MNKIKTIASYLITHLKFILHLLCTYYVSPIGFDAEYKEINQKRKIPLPRVSLYVRRTVKKTRHYSTM